MITYDSSVNNNKNYNFGKFYKDTFTYELTVLYTKIFQFFFLEKLMYFNLYLIYLFEKLITREIRKKGREKIEVVV